MALRVIPLEEVSASAKTSEAGRDISESSFRSLMEMADF
jgi:hypothetical protein